MFLAGGLRAVALSVLVAALIPASACASTFFGGPINGPLDGGTPTINSTRTNTTEPTGTTGVSPQSSAGTLVAVRIHHGTAGTDPGTARIKLLSGSAPIFVPTQDLGSFAWRPSEPAGIKTIVFRDASGLPRGVPISGGSYLAYVQQGGTAGHPPSILSNSAGAVSYNLNEVHESGARTYNMVNNAVEIQGEVETDADGDGYGDENQDSCATASGSCRVVQTSPPAAQVVEVVQNVQSVVSGRVELDPNSVKLSKDRSKLSMRLSCGAARSQSCTGKASAETAGKVSLHGGATKRTVVKLGSARFKIKPGQSKTVTIRVSSKARKRIKSLKKLRLRLTLSDTSTTKKTLQNHPRSVRT